MKAPGVRWRGRKPPEPPKYDNPRDLRSFPGWERKIQLWKKKRVMMWLRPKKKAALYLLESLTELSIHFAGTP